MRALAIVNPQATTTTGRTLDVIVNALGHDLKLDVAYTTRRDHAADLAAQARADGLHLVVAVGGDGTVNEVVNGLLGDDSRTGAGLDAPAFAVVPGGSTNVLARNLGLPVDAVEATGVLLDALRSDRRRLISLGRADDRWFTFTAGLGFDAAVVRSVEERRRAGRRATVGLYARAALRTYVSGRGHWTPMVLERPGHEPVEHLLLTMVSNCAPWTYVGPRGLVPSPEASFEAGLDVFGLTSMAAARTVRHVLELVAGRPGGLRGRDVVHLHDVDLVALRAEAPVPLQVDGDYLGLRSAVTFTAVRDALNVVV